MKPEKQVSPLGQSITLKNLGAPQNDAMFMWFEVSNGDDEGDFEKEGVEWHPVLTQRNFRTGDFQAVRSIDSELTTSDGEFCGSKEPARAFTVAELGELLVVDDDEHFCYSSYNEHHGVWSAYLQKRDEGSDAGFKSVCQTEGDTEAEARADMLIHLLVNKIIATESLNSEIDEKGK